MARARGGRARRRLCHFLQVRTCAFNPWTTVMSDVGAASSTLEKNDDNASLGCKNRLVFHPTLLSI